MKKIEKAGTLYIEELMNEIDANVRELVDIFRFLLKYQILFKGTGIEFAGLREYVPEQDDASKIELPMLRLNPGIMLALQCSVTMSG
ncbi:MAG: hypothetical protein B6U86_05030 [Candidatus Altiarchaeales archaeon ex4484_43]|nr:MAG: hypothetical protein B6U86_05030 [Candidatus Altiarchaeales archaeon ex4484_43]